MITIFVVDRLAEARTKLVDELAGLLQLEAKDLDLIPRVNIVPLSIQEIRFHGAPHICVIGPELIERELTEVPEIKRLFPGAILLARLRQKENDLAFIEQLARLGIDDVLSDRTTAQDFLKKLILTVRRASQHKSGTLIVVDGGKGGVGVTSVAAGLSDALVRKGKRTTVVDFDFETQDLSRFVQARPFTNENLQLLFDQSRPVAEEFVVQCAVPVWEDEPLLRCVPPIPESDTLFDSRSTYPRTLISILEIFDSSNDYVVVDVGSARGAFLRTLYRLADVAIFVSGNDPASLYASVDRLRHLRGQMSPDATMVLVSNGALKHGLSQTLLTQEFARMAGLTEGAYRSAIIPACNAARRWPGSGGTLFSQGSAAVKRGFDQLLNGIGAQAVTHAESKFSGITSLLRTFLQRRSSGVLVKTEVSPQVIELPTAPAVPSLPAPKLPDDKKVWVREDQDPHGLLGAVQFN